MGPIELLMIMGGLVVLYIIVKGIGRLFGVSRRRSYNNRFDDHGRNAAQNAQKNFQDQRKRNANVQKQTDDTIRKMTQRGRGW